ncbi:3-keto-disaccharide hydrolase [Oleiharenicola lentus]|uniref:3-keto-disaccharide hydrolase n=1 Tax=Oleiharenicola lentus TaxID=2508720 RepID=UPI003F671D5E
MTPTLRLLSLAALCLTSTLFAAEPVALFNGKDLSGWTSIVKTGLTADASTWTVADGALKCSSVPSGYLRTEKSYKNYTLTLEWRWSGPMLAPDDKGRPRSRNSGVLIHAQSPDIVWPSSVEAQLMETNAGDIYFLGETAKSAEITIAREKAVAAAGTNAEAVKRAQALRKLARQQNSSEKPAGEWNKYEIICKGDTLTLRVNGVEQNHTTKLSLSEGFIALQAEGAPIEFRNVTLSPLN